jgi:hypothetical protein
MAVFYQGPRPVLRGKTAADDVNPYTGERGVYSNWSIFNPSQILDGAPNSDHVPGTGRAPYGLQMSRWYTGLDNAVQPLDDPGNGPALSWWTPLATLTAKQGNDAQDIFYNFGHAKRTTTYSLWENWIYRGVNQAGIQTSSYGHVQRRFNTNGTANWFGTTDPYQYHGASKQLLENPGVARADKPVGNDHGFQDVNEWKGVPSTRAL